MSKIELSDNSAICLSSPFLDSIKHLNTSYIVRVVSNTHKMENWYEALQEIEKFLDIKISVLENLEYLVLKNVHNIMDIYIEKIIR